MGQSDLYIHGTDLQLKGIKTMMMKLAEQIGCTTDDESALNIPLGAVMKRLIGDSMHQGLLVGMNTEDPECVVLRVECKDIMPVYEGMLECFAGIDIEVDEDVEDVPWPFE